MMGFQERENMDNYMGFQGAPRNTLYGGKILIFQEVLGEKNSKGFF